MKLADTIAALRFDDRLQLGVVLRGMRARYKLLIREIEAAQESLLYTRESTRDQLQQIYDDAKRQGIEADELCEIVGVEPDEQPDPEIETAFAELAGPNGRTF